MINNTQAPPLRQRDFLSRLISGGFAALWLILLFSVSSVQAATPLADATISNRASADYTDTGGTPQHTLSNEVTTTVTQVGSYSLVNDNTKPVAPGTTVYMPHTLTNTGNGSDTFNITLPLTVDANLSKVAIFADANGDGLPDSATPLCIVNDVPACTGTNVQTGSLTPGGKFNFIVAMTVNATAPNTTVITEVVTATPVLTALYTPATLSNTDTLTVANDIPVFAVNKSIVSGLTSGPTGTPVTYKIAYTNNGIAAGPLYIKDIIGLANTAGFSYVLNNAKWSSAATATLTDDEVAADPAGITYRAITVGAITTIEAVVTNVAPNTSGFISFNVLVTPTAPVGTSETTNSATYAIATTTGGTCTVAAPCMTPVGTPSSTNQSPFIVLGNYNVVANNSATVSTDGDNVNATGFDLVKPVGEVAGTPLKAAPGATVSFNNEIWNTGKTSDTFNITIAQIVANASTAFPAGTSFQLFKSDGSTPLSSSDADGVPDTGPLLAGEHYTVVLRATIPANACSLIDCTTATNFTVGITATSKGDPTLKNTVFDQLAAITPPGVDLTNVGTLGENAGTVPGVVITDMPVASGGSAYFNLNVKNLGTAIDNYNLNYHLLNTGSDLANAAAFSAGSSLNGWTVTFHVNTGGAVCNAATPLGATVTTSGALAAGSTASFCAVVRTPLTGATASAGTYKTYFKVTSGSTGASDIKLDSVTLKATNKLSLLTPGVGQIQPSGTIVYPHSLVNGGNASCGGNFKFDITNNKAAEGWSYLLYLDSDNNGTLESTDIALGGGIANSTITSTMAALPGGSTAKLLVKVQAPASAISGAVDVITITAIDPVVGGCGTTAPVTDITNVLAGQIRLVKMQAVSLWNGASCDAAPAAGLPGTYSMGTQSQKPGQCIWYKIVATNEGDAPVSSVIINDATPSYTTYAGGGTCTAMASVTGVAALTEPASGSAGFVKCDKWTTVPAAATTQLEFAVRINP
jgi:trimeric autotransporter adhesin